MNTKSNLLKRVVKYLNRFDSFDNLLKTVGDHVHFKDFMKKKFNLKFISSGCSMYCFQYKKMVIKVGSDNLSSLSKYYKNKNIFGKFVAKIYWLHAKGFAVISEFINHNTWIKVTDYVRWQKLIVKALRKFGLDVGDAHEQNIVWDIKNKRGILIDYGCIFT